MLAPQSLRLRAKLQAAAAQERLATELECALPIIQPLFPAAALNHTLRLRCAVIAVSSADRDTGCWSWAEDGWDVAELLKGFLREWG